MPTTPSEAIRGNSGVVFTLKVKGATGSATAYDVDVKSIAFPTRDKDDSDITYGEVTSGETKDTDLAITFLQSTEATSLHRFLWQNPAAELEFVYGPHGNATPTAAKPHYTGTCKANGRPNIGVPARRSKQRGDSEYTMECLTGPNEKTS